MCTNQRELLVAPGALHGVRHRGVQCFHARERSRGERAPCNPGRMLEDAAERGDERRFVECVDRG
jgi:hypothetical protein